VYELIKNTLENNKLVRQLMMKRNLDNLRDNIEEFKWKKEENKRNISISQWGHSVFLKEDKFIFRSVLT
jgi:hypothetical protein